MRLTVAKSTLLFGVDAAQGAGTEQWDRADVIGHRAKRLDPCVHFGGELVPVTRP
jgi:hypothetical protein